MGVSTEYPAGPETDVISRQLRRALPSQPFMSQCRKEFSESIVVDTKGFIRLGYL